MNKILGFRPTTHRARLEELVRKSNGRFRLSELLRIAVDIGLDHIEKSGLKDLREIKPIDAAQLRKDVARASGQVGKRVRGLRERT